MDTVQGVGDGRREREWFKDTEDVWDAVNVGDDHGDVDDANRWCRKPV